METQQVPVVRGCGTRKPGGIYLETALSPGGAPISHFLCDPPIPVADPRDISAIGSQLVERDGVHHVIDWVGQEHYFNVADYVEEVKRFGISRRIAETVNFEKITEESFLLLVHAHAQVDNFLQYGEWICPKNIESHHPNVQPEPHKIKPMCAGIWWSDVKNGVPVQGELNNSGENDRQVVRKMPSFEYCARSTPENVQPIYRPAIFGAFPISRIALINGGDRHEEKLSRIEKSALPVTETNF
jgi:hypothetical protein